MSDKLPTLKRRGRSPKTKGPTIDLEKVRSFPAICATRYSRNRVGLMWGFYDKRNHHSFAIPRTKERPTMIYSPTQTNEFAFCPQARQFYQEGWTPP
jgi:hypothetical protein